MPEDHASRPPSRPLTLAHLAEEMRARFASVESDVAEVRILAESHDGRRSDDMRKMIREEVKGELDAMAITLTDTLSNQVKATIDPLAERIGTMEAAATSDSIYRTFVHDEMQRQAARAALEVAERQRAEAWRGKIDRTLALVYPLLIGTFLLLIGGNARAAGALPAAWYWAGVIVLGAIIFGWAIYRNLLRPPTQKNGTS